MAQFFTPSFFDKLSSLRRRNNLVASESERVYIYPRNLSFVLTAISLSLRTFGFWRTSSSFFVAAASYGCALRKSDLSKMICGGVIREHNGLMKRESYSGGGRGRDSAGCILAGY